MNNFYLAENFSSQKRVTDEELIERFKTIKLFEELRYTNQDRLFFKYEGEDIPIKLLKRPIEEVLTKEFVVAMSPANFHDDYTEMCFCSVHVFGNSSKELSYEDVINSLPDEVLKKVTAFCVEKKFLLDGYDEYFKKVDDANIQVAFVRCYRDKIKLEYIDDEKLVSLSARIKVFIFDESEDEHYLAPKEDLYEMKYTSFQFGFDRKGENVCVNIDEYEKIDDVEMIHRYSFPGFFKPSTYEIFSQIPEDIIDQVDAVEIIWYPHDAEDFSLHFEAFRDGFHTSIVRLYKKKNK